MESQREWLHLFTVCSERLILTRLWPLALARAETRLVFPTPGIPSSNNGFPNCMARRSLKALRRGPGASKEYDTNAALFSAPDNKKHTTIRHNMTPHRKITHWNLKGHTLKLETFPIKQMYPQDFIFTFTSHEEHNYRIKIFWSTMITFLNEEWWNAIKFISFYQTGVSQDLSTFIQ